MHHRAAESGGAKPELLAPAGDWESMRAAVANGADSVYFGLSNFNARARAANFSPDELPDVMHFLHAHNVRGFVTLNTLIFSDELEEVAKFVAAIASAAVDAVIVQDLGLVRLIRSMAPSLPIHASTQMTLTEPRGIEFVRDLGVDRVVLARELSLDDIRRITTETAMPVEVFVHGALCVAYSGQCLTSEALGGRSANRGQCAQACRLPYDLIVDGRHYDLGDRAYLLSPQDLAAYDLIAPLIDAGVVSFKIEGRLKGGPYVAATTQTYRKAIDAKIDQGEFHLNRREQLELAQTFSRGLTAGFLEGVNHQKLVRGRFPKSRGVRLGTVVSAGKRGIRVQLAETIGGWIKPGDGVLFDLGKPETQEPGGRVWSIRHLQGNIVELHFQPGSLEPTRVLPGCDVWKTDDPALRKRLEQSYSQDRVARRIPVHAKLSGGLGSGLTLELNLANGCSAQAAWPGPIESARKGGTTIPEIREQLGRLGDTPFELGELTVDLPASVMVPRSVLNELRRRSAAELVATRSVGHAVAAPHACETMRAAISGPEATKRQEPSLSVLVRSWEQLKAALASRPAAVYCDFEDLRNYKNAVSLARSAGVPIGLATLRILRPGEDGFSAMIVRTEPDIVLIRNLGSMDYFQKYLPQAKLVGDFSLNVANELTAEVLVRSGLERLVPSFDLNWEQFASLVRRAKANWFEPVIHQHMPMFHMEHCVFAAFLSRGKDHRDCGRPCDTHRIELRDRVGANFPVHPDTGCRNTVFNSVPQSAAEYVGRMLALGLRTFRVDLLRESAGEVGPLLERYSRLILGRGDGPAVWRELHALNQLGVTRGTLQLL